MHGPARARDRCERGSCWGPWAAQSGRALSAKTLPPPLLLLVTVRCLRPPRSRLPAARRRPPSPARQVSNSYPRDTASLAPDLMALLDKHHAVLQAQLRQVRCGSVQC